MTIFQEDKITSIIVDAAKDAIKNKVSKVAERLDDSDIRFSFAQGVKDAIADHWSKRFPHSQHWDATLVTPKEDGTVVVDVPGAGRAYHNVDISPQKAEWLTIPVHPDAKGKPATIFSNLFKPKGKNVLAANEGGSLVVYYALSKHVHQTQDESIMPSDSVMIDKGLENVVKKMK